jgi:hypothetical protein
MVVGMRREDEEMVIITKTYDLILWSCNHTGRLSAPTRARRASEGIRHVMHATLACASGLNNPG